MNVENPDLDDLLIRAEGGDPAAQARLVQELYPLVAKVVGAYSSRSPDADDWIQEVFLRVFSGLEQYRRKVPVEHWVARIAVNTCLDQLRAGKRRPRVLWTDVSEGERRLLDESLVEQGCTVDPADALAARELVAKLLEMLSPEDRVVVQMLHVEQRSVAEVASLLGWSDTNVKVRAFRARGKLRVFLRQLMGDDDDERP